MNNRPKVYPYTRCAALVRVLRLMQLLKTAHNVNLAWLASELRVSTRTIRRDLEVLAAVGVAVPHGHSSDMAE